MGKLIFIRFVLMALVLHTAQTEEPIYVPKGGDIHLPIRNLTEGDSIWVKRTDMAEPYYVYLEKDGHIDDTYQHKDYKNRTSRENNYIIIKNATTTDNGPYTITVIADEKNGFQTPPTRTYRVTVTAETVQNKDNSKDNNKDNSKDNSKDNNKDNNKDNSKDNNKDNKNLWLTIGLLLGGFIVVLAAVALGLFFYKPLKELCCVYFCQCLSKRESESIISL